MLKIAGPVIVAGLALRFLLAYLMPGSGFASDLASFAGWAQDLASHGLGGFYDRPGFHDYTPGYLYALYVVGLIGQFLGGLGDLVKMPAILADAGVAALVYLLARDLGASTGRARWAAILFLANPVSWFDSVVWGQVDSVGLIFLLSAVRELIRGRTERSAVATVVAALIKPQLGIFIPIVVAVTMRRAYRADMFSLPARLRGIERRAGWRRIPTTALAGLLTAMILSAPFGLSVLSPSPSAPYVDSGLARQVFSTAAGYPYASVNAFNPWALASVTDATGAVYGLAATNSWACDSQAPVGTPAEAPCQASAPVVRLGGLPAALVGAVLLLAIIGLVMAAVARRPDPVTIVVALAVLVLAFFLVPTRVHERYLFPLIAVGAVLAVRSRGWLSLYVISSLVTFLNLYFVLAVLYPDNPGISDWLGLGGLLRSTPAIVSLALAQTAVGLAAGGLLMARLRRPPEVPESEPPVAESCRAPRLHSAAAAAPAAWLDRLVPAGRGMPDASKPIRRSLDRRDGLIILGLFLASLLLRGARLGEPAAMHFDEVYHARTAMEFLQDWRFGDSHDIYEWTHPHLAKYAMAAGLVLLGGGPASSLGTSGGPVTAAAEEPARDDPLTPGARTGRRAWLVGAGTVSGYDLGTHRLVATINLPGASAIAYDPGLVRLLVGTAGGDLEQIDLANVGPLDPASPPPPVQRLAQLSAGVVALAAFDGGDVGALDARGHLTYIDTKGAVTGTAEAPGTTGLVLAGGSKGPAYLAAYGPAGISFFDPSAKLSATIPLSGVYGAAAVGDIDAATDLFVTTHDPATSQPAYAVINLGSDATASPPSLDGLHPLPGPGAAVVFDPATALVEIAGQRADGQNVLYVVEPRGRSVFDARPLGLQPQALLLDEDAGQPAPGSQAVAIAGDGAMVGLAVDHYAAAYRWPGVLAGALTTMLLYLLARILFARRTVAPLAGLLVLADGLFFVQSRIAMNDVYVGLFLVAAYTAFAALWTGWARFRGAFYVLMPVIGLCLGLALASKWVAAYVIGSMGILILARSALGRVILLLGLVAGSAVLGGLALAPGPGPNLPFLAIMSAATLGAAALMAHRPIGWTLDEVRMAVAAPLALGFALALAGSLSGHLGLTLLGAGLDAVGAAAAVSFILAGRRGRGPLADAPAGRPRSAELAPAWLRLGSQAGLPALVMFGCLVLLPVAVYVVSYLPWAALDGKSILAAPGHQSLLDLTQAMYTYHNDLTSAHPASSPWWAWPLDLKPVWFYAGSFANGSSAAIYDAGNPLIWWLGLPALVGLAIVGIRRRSLAAALVTIGFACQWLAWARIDRAAFSYHYYTSLPFLVLALAYFGDELYHGAAGALFRWAKVAVAGALVFAPVLWLLRAPLCAFVRVGAANAGSTACGASSAPGLISAPVALALVVATALLGLGILSLTDPRRLAIGLGLAIGLTFLIIYPQISALPIAPGWLAAYGSLLPSHLYAFQFPVNTVPRAASSLISGQALALGGLLLAGVTSLVWLRRPGARRPPARPDSSEPQSGAKPDTRNP